MHIPDGFLDAKTAVATSVLAGAGLAAALWQARSLPRRCVPLMGLCGAFIFAAQMLNFPVAAGSSGHLVGGVLAAALVGPAAAVVVLASVLIVQCLLFQDGGITALGANVLNLAIVNTVGGYLVYRFAARLMPGVSGRIAAVAFAAWSATVLAAVVCAGELASSGRIAWNVALPALVYVHMLIGCGEALITAMIVAGVAKSRPEMLYDGSDDQPDASPMRRRVATLAFGLLIALSLAMFASPFASVWPDGLDLVAEKFGIAAADAKVPAPIPDYKMPGVGGEALATGIAGAVGTVVVFVLSVLLARVLVRRQTPAA